MRTAMKKQKAGRCVVQESEERWDEMHMHSFSSSSSSSPPAGPPLTAAEVPLGHVEIVMWGASPASSCLLTCFPSSLS